MGKKTEQNQEDKSNKFLLLFNNKKSRNIIFAIASLLIIADAFLYFKQHNANINEQEVVASITPQNTLLNEFTPIPTIENTKTPNPTPTPKTKNATVPSPIPTPIQGTTEIKEITVTSLEELVKNIASNTKINIKGSDFKLVEFNDWRNMDVMYSKKSIAMNNIKNLNICGVQNDQVDFTDGSFSFINCSDIYIENIIFKSELPRSNGIKKNQLCFYSSKNLNIENCNFSGNVNYFMILFGIENAKVNHCTYYDSQNNSCIGINGGKSITFDNIDIDNCEDYDVFEISGSNVNINNSKISNILFGKSITTMFNNSKSNINVTNTSFLNNKNTYFSKYRGNIAVKDCIFKDNIFKEDSYQIYDNPQ